MKNRIKGFTLVECIVALAVLAIATLTMAQIYAGVARINRSNQMDNTSISNQIADIEKKTDTKAVVYKYGDDQPNRPNIEDTQAIQQGGTGKPPHKSTPDLSHKENNYIKIKKVGTNEEYSFPVDLYVFESRDNNDTPYSSMPAGQFKNNFNGNDDKYSARFKYIAAHNNETPPAT